jgi:cysteine desulfurase/selenocysteine lyase
MSSLPIESLSWARIQQDFPFLKDTVYLDSAATSQMPASVCEVMSEHYRLGASNVHRGVYPWSERATDRFEDTRKKVTSFINASSEKECLFTSGTTDAMNLLATSWGESNIAQGDTIVVTLMEHHSNMLPWTQLAQRQGAEVLWWNVTPDGQLDMSQLQELVARRPKLLALTWVSNVLGTINPLHRIVPAFAEQGTTIVLDGAQGVPHLPCDVQALGVDFLAFSAHKMCGPTGIGVLWGKLEHLERMPPYRFGGSMILSVRQDAKVPLQGLRVQWAELPNKFEGGTPNISGVHGLGAAIDYLSEVGMDNIRRHEIELNAYALQRLSQVPGLTMFGPTDPEQRSGVLSFDLKGIHPHDLATLLGREGVCVRAGHHCCQPLMRHWRRQGTTRASFYLYTTRADIDALADALGKAAKVFEGHC